MTTAEPTTALATREFTDQQIRTRLNAAHKPGFGLEKATPDQLNMVYLLAKHYDVDPAIDITLFQNRPFFTIDGRVRLMKRHPQYAGYRCRPLSKDEKDAWGYKTEEIVVECAIRTKEWGDIIARGKVSPDEFGRQPVARSHPQEMAEKRAIARASRMAFGQDVPDEDELGHLIIEQQTIDPVRQAALAAQQTAIYASDDEWPAMSQTSPPASPEGAVSAPPEEGAPTASYVSAAPSRQQMVKTADDPLNEQLAAHIEVLAELGADTTPFRVPLNSPVSRFKDAIKAAEQAILAAEAAPPA